MSRDWPFADADFADLAPERLVMHRVNRYLGDDISVGLADFDPADQAIVMAQYETLQELLELLRGWLDRPAEGLGQVTDFTQRSGWFDLIQRIRSLGKATGDRVDSSVLGQVVHDLRGGGFQALSIQLQFASLGIAQPEDILRMFFLARDHLKIMRNAVRDVDVPGYERDRAQKLHNIRLLIEKWHDAVYRLQDVAARIQLDCRFDGNVSERCLEFAALDRVLYNLINNAARHTTDGDIYLSILPHGQEPQSLRFVMANRVSDAQRSTLQARFADQLGDLFRGGFTTGGTGMGMQICADFVGNAYGVHGLEQGLAGGYFGARLVGAHFVSWFHWPVVAD